MINLMAKKKDSKKKKKETVEEAPAVMSQPGTYMRENGFLFLTEIFNNKTVSPLVKAITEYNLMPEELQPKAITLMINSPGGRIDSCLMLIDTMKMSSIPVNTFCTGLAASCGVVTLMAGDRRYASSTSQIMSHQYAAGSSGKEHELYGRMKSFEHTSKWMETHYKECTGLTVKKIRKDLLCPTDVWLNAEEALSYNIIDEVVNPYK